MTVQAEELSRTNRCSVAWSEVGSSRLGIGLCGVGPVRYHPFSGACRAHRLRSARNWASAVLTYKQLQVGSTD